MSKRRKKKPAGRAIGGHARAAAMTPEQRSEVARAAAFRRWNRDKGTAAAKRGDLTKCVLCGISHWRHRADDECPGQRVSAGDEGRDCFFDYFTPADALPKTKPRLRAALARLQRAHAALIVEHQTLRLEVNKHAPKCKTWPNCPCIVQGTALDCCRRDFEQIGK